MIVSKYLLAHAEGDVLFANNFIVRFRKSSADSSMSLPDGDWASCFAERVMSSGQLFWISFTIEDL